MSLILDELLMEYREQLREKEPICETDWDAHDFLIYYIQLVVRCLGDNKADVIAKIIIVTASTIIRICHKSVLQVAR